MYLLHLSPWGGLISLLVISLSIMGIFVNINQIALEIIASFFAWHFMFSSIHQYHLYGVSIILAHKIHHPQILRWKYFFSQYINLGMMAWLLITCVPTLTGIIILLWFVYVRVIQLPSLLSELNNPCNVGNTR
jgi:hypothetical protein